MLKETDDLSWYARKAVSRLGHKTASVDAARAPRIAALLRRLKSAGIKGDLESMTLYTRELPPGCRECLKGCGTNLFVTGLCTRSCFFCFNEKPRKDQIVVHGIPVKSPAEAPDIIRRYGLRSVGISGGEPLLFPTRVIEIIKALRAMGGELRIDLYTNGDPVSDNLFKALRDAGLDAIRFNLVAREFDLTPVRAALRYFNEVAIEIPVIPEQMPRLKQMIVDLDRIGVPYLNLHELFLCHENEASVLARGHIPGPENRLEHLLWKPTAASAEHALELLLFTINHPLRLSAYFCSCGTQELISRRGLIRRAAGNN